MPARFLDFFFSKKLKKPKSKKKKKVHFTTKILKLSSTMDVFPPAVFSPFKLNSGPFSPLVWLMCADMNTVISNRGRPKGPHRDPLEEALHLWCECDPTSIWTNYQVLQVSAKKMSHSYVSFIFSMQEGTTDEQSSVQPTASCYISDL